MLLGKWLERDSSLSRLHLPMLKQQERARYLREWRKQHEQLAVMAGPMKGLGVIGMEVQVGSMDMEAEEVKEAYEVVKRIDVLDVVLHLTNHRG